MPYTRNWLWLLNDLSRKDRHREPIELWYRVTDFKQKSGGNYTFSINPVVREDGTTICIATPAVANPKPEFDCNFAIDIGFGPFTPDHTDRGISSVLDLIHDSLRDTVIPAFNEFLLP